MRAVNTHRKKTIAAAAHWRCNRCCHLVDAHYEIDHVVPLHLGGANCDTNLQLLCARCHAAKTAGEMAARGPWASITYCRVCRRTRSLYFPPCCQTL